jgi:hypothetical protein
MLVNIVCADTILFKNSDPCSFSFFNVQKIVEVNFSCRAWAD